MTQMPPPASVPGAPIQGAYMRPHRGAMILVFGILAWVLGCFVFGIVAWVMGNNDLESMQRGEMDPTGEGLTKAGKIVGMINVILSIVSLALGIVLLVIMAIVGAAAAGASTTGG